MVEVAVYGRGRDVHVEKAGGTPAGASTGTGTADRANDGRRTTQWRSDRRARHWWEVDLGAPALIEALGVHWGSRPRGYRVLTSLDGRRFVPVVQRAGAATRESLYGARPTRARYVRVVATAGAKRPVALREIRALGPREPGFEGSRPGEGSVGTSSAAGSGSGGPSSDAVAPSSAPGVRYVGFTAGGGLHNSRPDELARILDRASGLGAKWIRVDLNWNVVQEKGPTVFEWGPQDTVIDAILARGM